jgi:hypothetical protein
MVALEEDLLPEVWREARNPAGDLVQAIAQRGHQVGIKEVWHDQEAIVPVSSSPLFRCL